MSHQLQPLPQGVDAPFASLAIIRSICVVLEVGVKLVQTIVGQMYIFLLSEVPISALAILLSRKTRKPILVDIEAQRINRCQGNVNAQVKLVAVNQERLTDVLTDNRLYAFGYLVDIVRDEDAFTLRRGSRLADPGHVWLGSHRVLQLDHLSGQDESLGEKFEMPFTF